MTSADVFPSKLSVFLELSTTMPIFVRCREHALGPSVGREDFRVCGARTCRYHNR